MTAEFGAFLGALALVASLAQAGAGLWAGHRGDMKLAAAAAATAQIAAALVASAFVVLVVLFLQSDFSVKIVFDNSHVDKPLLYKIAGAWGNHEGSMLLWCAIAAAASAALATFRGRLGASVWARAVGVQGLVTGLSLAYTLFLSDPFARLVPAPFEGRDMNPLLQDPALAGHPPLLYAGYVGLSIPFSLGIAALLEGRADAYWARALRPWILATWTLLTVGIALGSYWAYYELGWGGWWFWDPVENASFMPWLASAALLHSAIVTERRGSLAAWTVLLSVTGFGFALLGTFLVRSGVLTSVHAFAVDPKRGLAILALLGFFVGGGLSLFAWRAPTLGRTGGFAASSREGALLLNNLGLSVAAGVVLIGTLYPLLLQAATGTRISVGPPFFDAAFGPLMAAVFVALPFGPLLAWRSGNLAEAGRRLAPAALAAAAGATITLAFWRGPALTALGIAVGVWLLGGTIAYLAKRLGRAPLWKALTLPAAVWAMALAHAGLGIFTLGAVAEKSFRVESVATLTPGQQTRFAGRTITLERLEASEGPNYVAETGYFRVERRGSSRAVSAAVRRYPYAGSSTTEVGMLHEFAGDLYLAVSPPERGGDAWTVRLYFNPLIGFIFGGAALMALGGAFGLFALARRRPSPASETAPAAAHASPAE